MKNKINLNPNPMAKALVMQELTFRKMKDVSGTERRAQISLYGEPAWNRRSRLANQRALDRLLPQTSAMAQLAYTQDMRTATHGSMDKFNYIHGKISLTEYLEKELFNLKNF